MAKRGDRKLPETERRRLVARYQLWRQNQPKRLCADAGISRDTLRAWIRELRA